MISKRSQIITTALDLFANEAYDAVSTKKIAEKAQVSEGLIFKHFKNKSGLLDATIKTVEEKMNSFFVSILDEENPKIVIRNSIEIPFEISESDFSFWRLYLKLKWQIEYKKSKNINQWLDKLHWAFESLDFKDPEKEAGVLFMLIESIASNILLEGKPSQLKYKYFLIHRYTL